MDRMQLHRPPGSACAAGVAPWRTAGCAALLVAQFPAVVGESTICTLPSSHLPPVLPVNRNCCLFHPSPDASAGAA